MAGSTIIQLVLRARDDMSKGLSGATAKITALIAAFAGASAIKQTVAQEVAFYTDDRDQAFAGTVSIAVFSNGVKVEQVDNLTGNSWRFEGEASSNGRVLRGDGVSG